MSDINKTAAAGKRPAAVPGRKTILNFLSTAMQPVGRTLYVWGGAWNKEDTGGGTESASIGVSPRWEEFFKSQNASYDFENTRYQIHDGLDCSGFVGWTIYNTLETESGRDSYVTSSAVMAETLAGRGFGDTFDLRGKTPSAAAASLMPGDIMSMARHVWIVVGVCPDKSCVLVHSSPAGVTLCGIAEREDGDSLAVRLADSYMKTVFPAWYAKFPHSTRDPSFYEATRLHWNRDSLDDPEGVTKMTAEEVLTLLFGRIPDNSDAL